MNDQIAVLVVCWGCAIVGGAIGNAVAGDVGIMVGIIVLPAFYLYFKWKQKK